MILLFHFGKKKCNVITLQDDPRKDLRKEEERQTRRARY